MTKSSKLMEKSVTAVRHKTKIPFIYSHTLNHKVFHPQAISDEFSEFYRELYNLKDDLCTVNPSGAAIDSFLSSINLPSLSESQLQELNLPFSEVELVQAINSLPNGKSPGPDRFSNEYLKLYQPALTPYLCFAFNQAMAGGTVSS